MAGSIPIERHGDVALLRMTNPPVNGLSFAMRAALDASVTEALDDDSVAAIVIAGAGRMFCGGADIREFSAPPPPGATLLPAVLDKIEASPKPVVAAIHGVAAGGGMEVALACHVRLAAPGTKLGLPEVTLGILPGAGGTQRMPRLIGFEAALDVIVGGKLHPVDGAVELGFVDERVDGDLEATAVARARQLAADGAPLRRASQIEEHLDAARAQPELFERFRKGMAKRARGFDAPYACVECVEKALTLPYPEALKHERVVFNRLRESDQSAAQRHAFFSEREVAKIPDVPRDTATRPIDSAAVVGCGTMGGGIAMSIANAGLPVTVLESSQEALDRGMAIIRKNYAATVAKGRLSQADMDARMARITPTLSDADLGAADVVIEAVFEEMPLKKEVFARLDRVCKADAILATNTSTLDVNEIAASTSRPEQVIGTHFFSPANVMRLVENVRGERTSAQTIATVMKLSKTLGKIGALVGVCDGFVGNRMLYAYRRQADFLLEEGALPAQVDKAIYEFGLPMGPYQMADLTGLDVSWRVRKAQAPTRPAHLRYSPIADRICERGRYGQKTGAGWYRYEEGSRVPTPDPTIHDLIVGISKELGIARRAVADDEIVPRCLYPLVNEGAKILDEGLALRASDIDVIWMHGYGFPRYRGGPMFWADLVGLRTVYDTMSRLHDEHGEWLEPAPLLKRLAEEGKGFRDFGK
ncbi:MAG: 3-hydroxyacyl-CoA dehydrogenase NAD-binding domain-containing protein [Acidobacteria bacterium]|nr:3-hydroxyacyl-CoA dehydrogenase NAD-binding domain-containing protein [Acidobacteriota bacterium]